MADDDGEGDDDWFEAAFEDEADAADSDSADGTDSDSAGRPAEADADPDETPAEPDGEPSSEPFPDGETAERGPGSDGAAEPVGSASAAELDDAADSPAAEPTDGPPADADTDADDFADAFGADDGDTPDSSDAGGGDTPAPSGSDDGDGSPDDFADAFDAGGDDGGGGGDGDDDELFEDDFADAFAGASGGGSGGGGSAPQMPGGGGGGSGGGGEGTFGFDLEDGAGTGDAGDDFEEEDFESDIPRIDVGIEGLDEMIQGGVPERSLMVAVGEAGTGKTTFGLQFLHEAIQNGERAVFITLEESRERVVQSADEKGWNFSEHAANGDLAVVDIDPIEMANSLTSIRNELPRLVEDFGASRLVLDSVSLLEMMYDDQSTRRTEIYDFTKALKEAGVTTMLTSEASEDNAFASRYGVIEYLTDAVVVLRYIRPEDFRETRLAVEIQKIRDANHSRETKPYEITHEGISVYRQANIF
ncbi:KaiC domain-containing protein [Halobacterium rubrum]|uniref:KaiC domain-containing protein n=1 Tax=Halobacterium TaxID=2239 RepID=UPI001F1CED8F|nr:KaiC domain-containing protein [Halobacterium rubrum]MDH5019324.1 KaiC domain-containing protein [Halobacterium rubrum]